MKPTSEIFKYRKEKKFEEILTFISIIICIILAFYSGDNYISKILLAVLFTGLLGLMLSYTDFLNKNVVFNSESINIHKKIGQSNKFRFDEIQKITIREEDNIDDPNLFIMTIFSKKKNTRIIISDLDRPNEMIHLLAAKEKEFNFNIIHQNVAGEIIKESKID